LAGDLPGAPGTPDGLIAYRVMLLYNNVAQLRQFRGIVDRKSTINKGTKFRLGAADSEFLHHFAASASSNLKSISGSYAC
jgi:hypothetical protein